MSTYLYEIFEKLSKKKDADLFKKVLPYLIAFVEDEKKLERAAAYKYLIELYALWVGKRFQALNGIEKKFNFSSSIEEYTSAQRPVGDPFYGCYQRFSSAGGLVSFRDHTLTSKEGEVLIQYYHHTSPVPSYEKDFKKRIQVTQNNLIQAQKAGIQVELRLLSPVRGVFRFIEPKTYFSNLYDYDQVLEMYLANSLNKSEGRENLIFSNFGVNLGRYISSPLQHWINTQSMNELYEKLFSKYDIPVFAIGPDLVRLRAQLREDIQAEFMSSASEATIKEHCAQLIHKHHRAEKNQLKKNEKRWIAVSKKNSDKKGKGQVAFLFNQLRHLLETKEYRTSAYNYSFQAILLLLYTELGLKVATGCNDAKDRDGRLAVRVEAYKIYQQQHGGKYPDISSKKEYDALNEIDRFLLDKSSAVYVAEAISMPGFAKGFGVSGDPNRHQAAIFKDIFSEKLSEEPIEITITKKQLSQTKEKTGIHTLSLFERIKKSIEYFFHLSDKNVPSDETSDHIISSYGQTVSKTTTKACSKKELSLTPNKKDDLAQTPKTQDKLLPNNPNNAPNKNEDTDEARQVKEALEKVQEDYVESETSHLKN